MNHKIFFAAAGVALTGTLGALACGPWYPNRLLDEGAKALLRAPVSNFERELRPLRPEPGAAALRAKPPGAAGWRQQTVDGDLADLRAALDHLPAGTPPMSASERETLLAAYAAARQTLRDAAGKDAESLDQAASAIASNPELGQNLRAIVLPEPLPGEFADYWQGAIAFYLKDNAAAHAAWEKLLARPEGERHWRSTWAAYMLGLLCLREEQPAEAIKWFEQTRALALKGFADSLGLAATSLGWQAQAEFDSGAQQAGVSLYLDQAASGDGSAAASLRQACSDIFDKASAENLAKLAANDDARRTLTAYLLSYSDSEDKQGKARLDAWLAAIDAAGVRKVEEADRFALAAYQRGEFDSTARWLERAPADALMAMWLRAKMELRAGRIEKAAEWMSKVVRAVPDDTANDDPAEDGTVEALTTHSQHRQAHGEYAALQLGCADFTAALDGLLRAHFWRDAAYVAERVLTVDELRTYVDAHWPETPNSPPSLPLDDNVFYEKTEWFGHSRLGFVLAGEEGASIRYLLARRLARLGRFDEADPYYPAAEAPRFKAYVQSWRDGHDAKMPQTRRAWALWMAAKIARHEGMELLGTEVEPDWAAFGGDFEEEETSIIRARDLKPPQPASWETLSRFKDDPVGYIRTRNNLILPATEEEQRRLDAHHNISEDRFHYRYIAADLAWEAALLMPDNQESTARVLCAAGSWLKSRDRLTADRFYQAIERRCPETPLGKEAVKRRWFPPNVPEP